MHKDIVFVSTADWDNPFWTNKQHVAIELARLGYRVLYIDSLGLRRPSASKRDIKRIINRLFKAVRPPRKVRNNLWVWSPIILPWHSNACANYINKALLKFGLWLWLFYLGMKRQWIWTYNPLSSRLFNLNDFYCRIYHCVDEIKEQPGMPAKVLEKAEKDLSQKVEVIFTTSLKLTETRRAWNANTHYFPNVADFDHFNTALTNYTEIPKDLQNIPKPRLGFIGAISGYKIDFSLLNEIAEKRPDWSIVLIGEVGEGDPWTDISRLTNNKNIFLLGPREYNKLPCYLKGIDVALLPNTINSYTESMFPMKFIEYLASGRPIVSVDLKALIEFSDVASFNATNKSFISSIEKVLAGDIPPLEARLEAARQHTYKGRTQRMLKVIEGTCC